MTADVLTMPRRSPSGAHIATIAAPDEPIFFSPAVCQAAAISNRQLDYWARTGLIPGNPRHGSGYPAGWTRDQLRHFVVIGALVHGGVNVDVVRRAIRDGIPASGVFSLPTEDAVLIAVDVDQLMASARVRSVLAAVEA